MQINSFEVLKVLRVGDFLLLLVGCYTILPYNNKKHLCPFMKHFFCILKSVDVLIRVRASPAKKEKMLLKCCTREEIYFQK